MRARRYAALTTCLALAGAALTSCTGAEQASSPPSSHGAHPTAVTPSTPPSPPAASNGPTDAPVAETTTTTSAATPANQAGRGAPGVPPAARHHTKAGAEAFVRHYNDQLNIAWATPKSGLLPPLALQSCKTCKNYESAALDGETKGTHLDGPSVTWSRAVVQRVSSVPTVVYVWLKVNHRHVVDRQGNPGESVRAGTEQDKFVLKWTSTGWRVGKIYVVKK